MEKVIITLNQKEIEVPIKVVERDYSEKENHLTVDASAEYQRICSDQGCLPQTTNAVSRAIFRAVQDAYSTRIIRVVKEGIKSIFIITKT